MAAAFDRFGQAPHDVRARAALARLVRAEPAAVPLDCGDMLHRLIVDPDVDPNYFTSAAWMLLNRLGRVPDDPRAIANWLETDSFAQDLLTQGPVGALAGELPMTAARRWLLLSGAWSDCPRAIEALRCQAVHNGGAWPFDEDERAALANVAHSDIALAYLPTPPRQAESEAGGVTQAVAAQYERWPYPVWSRAMAMGERSSLVQFVSRLDPSGAAERPPPASILIAGCGTGWEAAAWAQSFPDAQVTAIDISEASLNYATSQCRIMGLHNIRFERLDLHRAETLGQFDVIICSGVLHHLEDPEAGWAALTRALAPGGVMRIMVYSRIARLLVHAMRRRLSDIAARPIDDDVLRAARARLMAECPDRLRSFDYFTLGGIHDFLFNVHEDPFDVARIERGIRALGLDFLGFKLPDAPATARYRAAHPDDPRQRDFAAWQRLEIDNPMLFDGMYCFWCRKPGDAEPASLLLARPSR